MIQRGMLLMMAAVLPSSAKDTCTKQESGVQPYGFGYRGCQTKTRSGATCQKWTEDLTNERDKQVKHYIKDPRMKLMFDLGDHNYCRNPWPRDPKGGIWCYVGNASTGIAREFCDEECPDCTQVLVPKGVTEATCKLLTNSGDCEKLVTNREPGVCFKRCAWVSGMCHRYLDAVKNGEATMAARIGACPPSKDSEPVVPPPIVAPVVTAQTDVKGAVKVGGNALPFRLWEKSVVNRAWEGATFSHAPDSFSEDTIHTFIARNQQGSVNTGTPLYFTCPYAGICDFIISVYHCRTCAERANGGLPALASEGWTPGSCVPKFDQGEHKNNIMVGYHKQVGSGETYMFKTTAPLKHYAIYLKQSKDQCFTGDDTNCESSGNCVWNEKTSKCNLKWCVGPRAPFPAAVSALTAVDTCECLA